MLQNLSEEIRECLLRAEECKRMSKTGLTPSAIKDYLDMEQRWLNHNSTFSRHLFDPDIVNMSAAFEAALHKLGLVDRTDPATMAVRQPLRVRRDGARAAPVHRG
jgi:hypothetical protein